MKMRILFIVILSAFLNLESYAQYDSFKFTYFAFSFFPTQEISYPVISIESDTLSYKVLQENGKYEIEKYDEYIDTLWSYDTVTYHKKIRTSSIDSILLIARPLKDSIIDFNPSIIDGINYIVSIADKNLSVYFEFGNTFDSNAISIVKIANTYLPPADRLDIDYFEKQLLESAECWKEKEKEWHKKRNFFSRLF